LLVENAPFPKKRGFEMAKVENRTRWMQKKERLAGNALIQRGARSIHKKESRMKLKKRLFIKGVTEEGQQRGAVLEIFYMGGHPPRREIACSLKREGGALTKGNSYGAGEKPLALEKNERNDPYLLGIHKSSLGGREGRTIKKEYGRKGRAHLPKERGV